MQKIGFAIVAGLLLSSAAMAAEPFKGGYIGAGFGNATSNVWDNSASALQYTTVLSKKDSDSGFKIYGGISSGVFGFEMGYYDFGSYSMDGRSGSVYTADSVSVSAVAISVTANWTIASGFAVGGKAGLAGVTGDYKCVANCAGISNHSNNTSVPMLGAGVSYAITRNLALRADYETFFNAQPLGSGSNAPKADFTLISGSVEYRF